MRSFDEKEMFAVEFVKYTFLFNPVAPLHVSWYNFCILNLTELTHEQFIEAINELSTTAVTTTLCMIDEVDSRSAETWPYEEFFSCLDWNTKEEKHIVLVLKKYKKELFKWAYQGKIRITTEVLDEIIRKSNEIQHFVP